ncbi:NEDD8-conjugating enzyme UBE2F-like [Styela clava]
MLTLSKKIKESGKGDAKKKESSPKPQHGRVSIRDRLLIGEVQELEKNITSATCKVTFPEADCLHKFYVEISPDEGMWEHGTYEFKVEVPENYNIAPPNVKCMTRIWHPNITENGDVCLSLLRDHSLDGTGWVPTRTLKEVIWGLCSLFTDLCDFDDPLNVDAADHYHRDKKGFTRKVQYYIQRYAYHEK